MISQRYRWMPQIIYLNFSAKLTPLSSSSLHKSEGRMTIWEGEFRVTKPLDTFLDLPGWHKGVAFLNGFNLGRYW